MSGGRQKKTGKTATKGALIAVVVVLVVALAAVIVAITGSGAFRIGGGRGSSGDLSAVTGEWAGDSLYIGDTPIDASLFGFYLTLRRDGTFDLSEFDETGSGTYTFSGTGIDNDGEEYSVYEMEYTDAEDDSYTMNLMYYRRFNGGGEYTVIVFSDELMIGFVRAN